MIQLLLFPEGKSIDVTEDFTDPPLSIPIHDCWIMENEKQFKCPLITGKVIISNGKIMQVYYFSEL